MGLVVASDEVRDACNGLCCRLVCCLVWRSQIHVRVRGCGERKGMDRVLRRPAPQVLFPVLVSARAVASAIAHGKCGTGLSDDCLCGDGCYHAHFQPLGTGPRRPYAPPNCTA